MKIKLFKNWYLDLTFKKVAALLACIAAVLSIATGVIFIIDKVNPKPMWEQSIPLDELEKYRNGDGSIHIEKGITINPEEKNNE